MSVRGFGYARARIQARHGQRPDEGSWRRLHASRELGHLLEVARGTPLRRWVEHLSSSQAPHELERSLRADLAAYVRELSSWVPEPWARAVRWTERLALLPFVVAAPDALVPSELAAARGSGELDPARELAAWHATWPRTSRDERAGLDMLVRVLAAHRRALESAPSERDGWLLSAELERRLLALFRARPEQPVTPFCHLALTALDLERLRGALVRRALFVDVESEVAWV